MTDSPELVAPESIDDALWSEIIALQEYLESAFVAHAAIALARLRIADHLGEEPRSVETVAAEAAVDALSLRRVLQFLEGHGFVRLDDAHGVSLRPRGRLLRRASPMWASLAAPGSFDVAHELEHAIRTGQSAFEKAHGDPFFVHLGKDAEREAIFGEAMNRESTVLNVPAVATLDLASATVVADIGGGTGELLAAVLRANPHARGVLVDQPSVLERALPELTEGPLSDRCTLVPGDLFGDLPVADAYLMARVVHDWPDTQVRQILAGLRRVAPPHARLHLVEMVLPSAPGRHLAKFSDMILLLLVGGGRERAEAELRQLLHEAGWRLDTIVPTDFHAVLTASVVDSS